MPTRHLSLPLALGLVLACATAWSADTAPAHAPEAAAVAAMPAATSTPKADLPPVAAPAAPATPAAPASADKVAAPAGAASAPETAAAPAAAASAPVAASLDGRIQDAKLDIIKLNRDLLVLEEELLFPANTQVAVFVSMDVGKMFELDSVQVKLDDKLVASYLYTPLEVKALHRGGVQRVFLGNLKAGDHELVAFFTGKGPHDRDYKRGTTLKFEKGTEARYIELRIRDSEGRLQPEFDIKTWQ
jgi:hypothetical protein